MDTSSQEMYSTTQKKTKQKHKTKQKLLKSQPVLLTKAHYAHSLQCPIIEIIITNNCPLKVSSHREFNCQPSGFSFPPSSTGGDSGYTL